MNTTRATAAGTETSTGSATSADGTTIGYRQVGRGPAVVVLHGSNESAASHTQLARALASRFTVYLPDRRGRGLSGPRRPGHSMRTEVEDLQAVVAAARVRRAGPDAPPPPAASSSPGWITAAPATTARRTGPVSPPSSPPRSFPSSPARGRPGR
jgi:pimeloyl-ACP methyl ester carboxylesterase